jgi:hypothetical protein
MDKNRGQSLITKYVWVIDTIHRIRKISFKKLNELWLSDEIAGKIKRMWNKYKED